MSDTKTIFLVGNTFINHNTWQDEVSHACASKATAEKRYDELRQASIIQAEVEIDTNRAYDRDPGRWPAFKAMLEADDREACDKHPWATPVIREIELEP